MEVILFIGLIIIIVLISNAKSSNKENTADLKRDINSLNKKLADIQEKIQQLTSMPLANEEKTLQEQKMAKAEADALQEQRQRIAQLEVLRREREERKNEKNISSLHENSDPVKPSLIPLQSQAKVTTESWWDKWLLNNPDLEKFIGENLLNKIGISVLVLGIAFFVKYAIDKNWIREWGRVAIGIGCGTLLIGIAHRLKNNYRSFSSVLVGGGLAVFYFTIAFAFHQYKLIGQTPAFIIMIIITAFAVLLSLLYDKLEVAVLAAIGGFITPFLVSNGSGNYVILFTYLVTLNIGLLALSYFKKWPLINILSLFFTVIIYGTWMLQTFEFSGNTPPYASALLFATIFFLLFLVMNMIHNIRYQKPFRAFDFFILLLINLCYYSAGMAILSQWYNGDYKGLFTIGMSAVNFTLAFYFFKTKKADNNLLYLLIGLTLTFISLAAPVQLHGHAITLFWSAETVLLYWLYQQSGIRIFKYSSALVMVLMLGSLFIDWNKAYILEGYHLPLIFTGMQGFITNLTVTVSFVCYYFLLRKEKEQRVYLTGIPLNTMQTAMLTSAVVLLYITCIFSVNLYFSDQPDYARVNPYHLLITNLLTIVIIQLLQKFNPKSVLFQLAMIFFCYVAFIHSIGWVYELRDLTLKGQYPYTHYILHWVADIGMLFLFWKAIGLFRTNGSLQPKIKGATWVICISLMLFLSLECQHLYVSVGYHNNNISYIQQQFQKAGLTILWGICSFMMMWLGMKYKYKTLRIISLSLFSMALLKLFLFDIRNISEGGKIAAFIMLGILLLTISFMYQKLKKIIIDDGIE